MKNDVAEMALSSQVFTCQCQLCKAQLQLTCSWSSAAEPGSSISGTDGFCRNDQACVKEALGLVQNVLESNNERLTGMQRHCCEQFDTFVHRILSAVLY